MGLDVLKSQHHAGHEDGVSASLASLLQSQWPYRWAEPRCALGGSPHGRRLNLLIKSQLLDAAPAAQA